LKRGSTVITARDSGLAARMIKRAMISGLMSVGSNVLDLRSMPLPITRHATRGAAASGGMYVRIHPHNPRLLLIEFLDQNGVYLSKAAERKLETIFFREDFGRADVDQIGGLEFASRSIEQYHEDFVRHIGSEPIIARAPKVVADFTYGRVATVFPRILGRLGCDVIALNAYVDSGKAPKTEEQREAHLPNLTQIVRTVKADLGVLFQNDGERLSIVDENGAVIEGDMLLVLFAVLVARTHERARIAVPVTAPAQIENLVLLHGGTVQRTKTDVRSLMSISAGSEKQAPEVDFAGDSAGGFIFSRFQPGFDSMFAFGKLLEMLATTGLSVSELTSQLPSANVQRADVRCPWEVKGRIMRELTKEAEDGGNVELIDGIKIYRDHAWALILPDASEPYFHVYAEGATPDESRDLVSHYVGRIEGLRG
jgi:mannose-1-phosphate guanylyltransferase/phosphomannomutase